jgi:hypothetical protein
VLGGTNAQEGRLFTVNQTNLTTYLNTAFTRAPHLIPAIRAAYPVANASSNTSQYDTIAQIYTDLTFQCPQALWANATAQIGIPTWRYFFNASFANTQSYHNLGVFHASEVALVFASYDRERETTQEYALSRYMQGVWARFAKNPEAGPGWNGVGTGKKGNVLMGAYDEGVGGVLVTGNGSEISGEWSLGILGDVGEVKGSGVTVVRQSDVDTRCELFRELYVAVVGEEGMPGL